MNPLVLIPARYASTRFPAKPLALLSGKTMIEWVCDNARQSGFDYSVVTDSQEIEDAVHQFNGNVVRVDDEVETGSERIALAYQRFFADKSYDLIINLQGDEPLLKASLLKKVAVSHDNSHFDIMTALKKRSRDEEAFINNNVVKAAYSVESKQCLYFSRASIPFDRSMALKNWFQHIGLYSYKVKALEKFVQHPQTGLETAESLEQLRALEMGMTIGAVETNLDLIGVDSPEDIQKVEQFL